MALVLPNPKRASTYACLKSLVNVESGSPVDWETPGQEPAAGQIIINFPCMPDTIELVRKANYKNQASVPTLPDGLHIYDSTEPLQIPVTFTLHGYDEYCGKHGPLMLLSLAAKLHALTLPIIPDNKHIGTEETHRPIVPGANGSNDSEITAANKAAAEFDAENYTFRGKFYAIPALSRFAYPPACLLNIMLASTGGSDGASDASKKGTDSLGIYCVGFVSDVKVVFKGPWLQGSWGSNGENNLRNLPSEAEFGFTFVHQPGYTNDALGASPSMVITTSLDIRDRLYNTANMLGAGVRAGVIDLNGEGGSIQTRADAAAAAETAAAASAAPVKPAVPNPSPTWEAIKALIPWPFNPRS